MCVCVCVCVCVQGSVPGGASSSSAGTLENSGTWEQLSGWRFVQSESRALVLPQKKTDLSPLTVVAVVTQ